MSTSASAAGASCHSRAASSCSVSTVIAGQSAGAWTLVEFAVTNTLAIIVTLMLLQALLQATKWQQQMATLYGQQQRQSLLQASMRRVFSLPAAIDCITQSQLSHDHRLHRQHFPQWSWPQRASWQQTQLGVWRPQLLQAKIVEKAGHTWLLLGKTADTPGLFLQNYRQSIDIPCKSGDCPGGESRFSPLSTSASLSRALRHSREANFRPVEVGIAGQALHSSAADILMLANCQQHEVYASKKIVDKHPTAIDLTSIGNDESPSLLAGKTNVHIILWQWWQYFLAAPPLPDERVTTTGLALYQQLYQSEHKEELLRGLRHWSCYQLAAVFYCDWQWFVAPKQTVTQRTWHRY